MYKISKQFSFSASHILRGLPATHPCARLHGHNYTLTVFLKSETLDQFGFVKDYRDLSLIKDYIEQNLDHRHLNDVFDFNPTAENLAKKLHEIFSEAIPEIYAVQVSETPKTTALYDVDCK